MASIERITARATLINGWFLTVAGAVIVTLAVGVDVSNGVAGWGLLVLAPFGGTCLWGGAYHGRQGRTRMRCPGTR